VPTCRPPRSLPVPGSRASPRDTVWREGDHDSTFVGLALGSSRHSADDEAVPPAIKSARTRHPAEGTNKFSCTVSCRNPRVPEHHLGAGKCRPRPVDPVSGSTVMNIFSRFVIAFGAATAVVSGFLPATAAQAQASAGPVVENDLMRPRSPIRMRFVSTCSWNLPWTMTATESPK
jgi:hypothetical protein